MPVLPEDACTCQSFEGDTIAFRLLTVYHVTPYRIVRTLKPWEPCAASSAIGFQIEEKASVPSTKAVKSTYGLFRKPVEAVLMVSFSSFGEDAVIVGESLRTGTSC